MSSPQRPLALGPCLDDGAIARWTGEAATAREIGGFEAHLEVCAACRQRVEVARAAREPTLAPSWLGSGGAPARGEAIGRYLALDVLGRGGMGVVVAAYDPELDRKVAVKLIAADHPADDDASEGHLRLIREAKAMARLSHPNVVPVFDAGTCAGGVFIAMELVDGTTLGRWRKAEPRAWSTILARYRDAGRGLAAAHAVGLVHRDFKPDNVLVARTGEVKVTDFGLVTASRSDGDRPPALAAAAPAAPIDAGDLTRTGAIMGTPRYMAPEQFLSQAVDARTDQFAFCASLYEALWLTPPFAGDTVAALAVAVTAGELREPPDSAVPLPVRRAVLRGLARDPAARHPSMEALLALLAPAAPPRRWAWIAGALAAVGAIAIGAVLAARGGGAPTADACAMPRADLDGAWTGAARAALIAGLTTAGPGFGDRATRAVVAGLDRYATSWADARAGTCRARRRGELDPGQAQRRTACLERRRLDAAALIAVLRTPDAVAAASADRAVHALAAVTACTDAAQLDRRALPTPDLAPAVAAAEAALASARAEFEAGHYLDARTAVAAVAEGAAARAYPPLAVDAALLRGRVAAALGDTVAAERELRRVVADVDRLGLAELAVAAWSALAFAGSDAGDLGAAELAARLGLAEALRRDDRVAAVELGTLAQRISILRGDLAAADAVEADLARATAGAAEHDWRARVAIVSTRASRLRAAGQLDLADAAAREALDLTAAALGDGHPELWASEYRLAAIAFGRGETARARDLLARVRTRLAAAAVEGAAVVNVLYNAAILDADQPRAAAADLDRAQAIADRVLPPTSLDRQWIDYARGVLALEGGDLDDARARFTRVAAAAEGRDRRLEASARENLGRTLARLDEYGPGEAELRRAVTLRELESPTSLELARARGALARVLMSRDRHADALPVFDRALAVMTAAGAAIAPEAAVLRLYRAAALNELDREAEFDAAVAGLPDALRATADRYELALALLFDADRRWRAGEPVAAQAAAREAAQQFRAAGYADDAAIAAAWLRTHGG
ncbi:MAG: serine/threonine protein kinase [Myxococcales bacterium]|nr:serine/threonine protein kinase [Myxococcales bacterium]